MSQSFKLGGDPGSIRSSATVWGTFASDASTASSDVRSLDTSDFQGDEADTYRDKVSDDLPPRLDTTSQAWQVVSAALRTYAGTLEDLQSRMSTLKARADEQSEKVGSAQSALSSAQSADRAHAQNRQDASGKLKPGETLPPDTYHAQSAGAQSSLSSAKQALQDTIDAAATVRSEHNHAVEVCCNEIDRAKKMRFADPPGFWGKLAQSVGDWIKDHADILKTISSVLKTISGIAGMLALIPCLAPIMGPIALVTGGVALGIDVAVKLATGEGSWLQIGVDALGMIPGVRAAKLAFGADVALTGYNVTQGNASVADLAMTIGLGSLGMRGGSKGGELPKGSGGDHFDPPSTGGHPPSDQIKVKLQDITNQVHADFNAGTIKLTVRQQLRVKIRRAAGEPNDMFNTFKGDRIDKHVRDRVKVAARTDPDLARVTPTPRGQYGPDFKNVTAKQPHEADWYDVTTHDAWDAHNNKYHVNPPPGRADYGDGVGIFWR